MKAAKINTLKDAQRYVEGCINDLVDDISTKEETISHLGEYTFRLMEIFEKNSKKKEIKKESGIDICHCINWHPSISRNMGKKDRCSYCRNLRQKPLTTKNNNYE